MISDFIVLKSFSIMNELKLNGPMNEFGYAGAEITGNRVEKTDQTVAVSEKKR